MTRKIVSEMTYNVSMGTLNPTIPYHTLGTCAQILNFLYDLQCHSTVTGRTDKSAMRYALTLWQRLQIGEEQIEPG